MSEGGQVLLLVGYSPARMRHVEELVSSTSAVDVMRLAAPVSISDIRNASRWIAVKPSGQHPRTLVVPGDGLTPSVQSGMLLLLENLPESSRVLIDASSKSSLLRTIQSRCRLVEFRNPDFGQAVYDLKRAGYSLAAASHAARLISNGYDPSAVPSSEEFTKARSLIDAAKVGNLDVGTAIAASFNSSTVQALRSVLADDITLADAFQTSYVKSDPAGVAILVLDVLRKRGS